MSSTSTINSLQRYFSARFQEETLPGKSRETPSPSLTLSRETGAGGLTLAGKLAAFLEGKDGRGTSAWTVFDRDLVGRVLEDHHLPQKVGAYMPEGPGNELEAYIGEFLGLHPSITTLVDQTNETIRKLARTGRAILVGRGGNFATFSLRNTYHVRLVSGLDKRVERVRASRGLDYKAAKDFVHKTDRERTDYVRKHFDKRIDDPLHYHLIVNTGLMSDDEAVSIIGNAVLHHAGLPEN